LRNNLIGTNTINQNNVNSEIISLPNNIENRSNQINNFPNSNLINMTNSNENSTGNQNNNLFSNPFYKEKGTQTDLALNSMLTKESQ
jgi:hypothetical protein